MKVYATEHELLQGLHQGDRLANEQLYQEVIGQLCCFIESITGDNKIIEDIAADSMVKGLHG